MCLFIGNNLSIQTIDSLIEKKPLNNLLNHLIKLIKNNKLIIKKWPLHNLFAH